MSSSARVIHFNALPEAARVRFADCLAGKAHPAPLVTLRTGRKRGWIFLTLIGGMLLFVMWATPKADGFLPKQSMIGFALGTLFTVAGVLGIMHSIRLKRSLPFRAGRYLFATDYIEATGPVLRLYNLRELKSLNATHHYTNGVYTGTRFVVKIPGKTINFSISGRKKADGILSDIHMARATLAYAIKNQDLATLQTLDPLFEVRSSGAWDSLGATAPSLPRDAVAQTQDVPWPFARAIQPWAMALLAAAVLAPGQWWLGNRLRDESIFQTAQQAPSEQNYRLYLQGGTVHAEEVKAELLPKAVLAEAKHRHSVKLLRDFTHDFPGHHLVPEAEAEIHATYQNSLQQVLRQADPSAHDFLRQLFAWLEKNPGQPVEVSFDAPSSADLNEQDRTLLASGGKAEGVPIAPISPSFTPDRCRSRESKIVDGLKSGFNRVVTGDILTLSGARKENREGRPAPLARPTLAIHYVLKPSQDFYYDEGKTRAFVGITVDFTLALSVPGAGAPLNLAFAVQPPDHFTVHHQESSGRYDRPSARSLAPDATVYDTMAGEAFARLSERLGATFFQSEVK